MAMAEAMRDEREWEKLTDPNSSASANVNANANGAGGATRPVSKSLGKQFAIPQVKIGSDGNVKYLVTLSEPGKGKKQKWTRFSSFHSLKNKIKLALPRNLAAKFPKKYWKWFVNHNTNQFMENRRAELEDWLQQAVDFLSSNNHLYTEHFASFASFVKQFSDCTL